MKFYIENRQRCITASDDKLNKLRIKCTRTIIVCCNFTNQITKIFKESDVTYSGAQMF